MDCYIFIESRDNICTGTIEGNIVNGIIAVAMKTDAGYNSVVSAYDNNVALFLHLQNGEEDLPVTINERNAQNRSIHFQEIR